MPAQATAVASAPAATRGTACLRRPAPSAALIRPLHASAGRSRLCVRVFQEAVAAPPPAAKPAAAEKPKDVDHVPLVLEELRARKKIVIAQTAPAVRIAIGEELGLGVGVNATGKLVSRKQ